MLDNNSTVGEYPSGLLCDVQQISRSGTDLVQTRVLRVTILANAILVAKEVKGFLSELGKPHDVDHANESAGPSNQPVLPDRPFPSPYRHANSPPPTSRAGISNWILKSPTRTSIFLKIGDLLGYGSPKQVAGRRAQIIYTECSQVASGPESAFWYGVELSPLALSLPPTFQSWFTITNLHIWMATVRLRALPPSHGRAFVQALIDHFFFDVEDRLRAVLGKNAPERLVTRQMKILREQWNGLGISCDIAFITGDKEMASTIWRNLLGARGARGIAYTDTPSLSHETQVNNNIKTGINDPTSGGVVDFEGPTVDRYIFYPQLMLLLTSYVRKEITRLENISDKVILGGEGRGLRELIQEIPPAEPQKIKLDEAFRFESIESAGKEIGVTINEGQVV